MAKKGFPILE